MKENEKGLVKKFEISWKPFWKVNGRTVPLGLKHWYFHVSILLNDIQIVNGYDKIVIEDKIFIIF